MTPQTTRLILQILRWVIKSMMYNAERARQQPEPLTTEAISLIEKLNAELQ